MTNPLQVARSSGYTEMIRTHELMIAGIKGTTKLDDGAKVDAGWVKIILGSICEILEADNDLLKQLEKADHARIDTLNQFLAGVLNG